MGKKLKIALCVTGLIILFLFVRSHLSYSDGNDIELKDCYNGGHLGSDGNYSYFINFNFEGMPTDYKGWSINAIFKDSSGNEVANKTENCTYGGSSYMLTFNSPLLLNISTVSVEIKDPNGEVKFNKDVEFNMSDVITTPPDTSSSNTSSSSDSTSSSRGQVKASASTKIYFYNLNEPAPKSGYDAAIVIDGTPYYIGTDNVKALESYSSNFDVGTNVQYTNTNDASEAEIKAGLMKFDIKPKATYDNGDFELSIGKALSFDWTTGEVGLNKEAKIITTIYDSNGNKL